MISKEEARAIAIQYLKDRNRRYDAVAPLEKIRLKENIEVFYPFSKYYEQLKNIYTVPYEVESYNAPLLYFIVIDADTSEVLFTVSKHGFVEDWED